MTGSTGLDALIDDRTRSIIICCGSGGVGKTTTSAALALRAAERGRRVAVMTIDPARRLAQALGLTALDNEPRPVEGAGRDGGALFAMTLDMKRTFDEIVEAHAEPDRAAAILANPIYQSLSSSFAGTQEYMAMEKLAQLRARIDADHPWDLVIVDTPPSRAALDFLDAPARIGSFLDGPFMRILSAPARTTGRAGLKLIGAGTGLVAGIMDRILGAQLIGDAQVFVTSLDAVFGGFRQRAERTYRMLQEDGTAFVVVAAPESDALREAAFFVDRLRDEDMPLASVVVNRVTVPSAPWLTAERAAAAVEDLDPDGRQRGDSVEGEVAALLRLHGERARRRDQEQRLIAAFLSAHGTLPCLQVPALAGDVHDLEGLRRIGELLSG